MPYILFPAQTGGEGTEDSPAKDQEQSEPTDRCPLKTTYHISAIKRRGYYLIHLHAIYCGYCSKAVTNHSFIKLNISKEARKRIGAPCMHKEEVLFQPWAVRYHHNHPDKVVGNAKAITVARTFSGHMSLAPCASSSRPQKEPNKQSWSLRARQY